MREYLLLKRHSLDEWRRLAESSHSSQYQQLLKQADSHHDTLPPAEHPSDSITYIGTAVLNLALARLLCRKVVYLESARRWMARAIAYPHWGKERMPDHDLDAAWLLFGLSLGYDWLKGELPPDERAALRDKLILQAKKLYEFALETEGNWWSSAYWQNHNWICYGGLATAAYALRDEFSEAGKWAARARDNLAHALAYMPEDGSNYEGPVYWRYGVIWFLIHADLLQQETGENLHDSPFLRNTFFYRLYLSGPNLIDTANFGDCHDRRSAHTAAVYARLADLYGIGEAQWLYQRFYEVGEWKREGAEGLVKPGLLAESGLEFLWYQPAVAPSPIAKLPLSREFPDLGLVAMRSSWAADAVTMAFKSGAPNGIKAWHTGHSLNRRHAWQTLNGGHDHPDANSFIILSGDDYITVDDGYAKEKLTRNHSTLLVDGRGQYAEGAYNAFRGLDETWGARLEAITEFGNVAYARGEAARAYERNLQLRQFSREILFLEGDAVIIHDTVSADGPHQYEWLLQTDRPPDMSGSGEFIIKNGGAACRLHILQPAEITHQTREQEITANPTSAKPDWIISNTQYALALSPTQARKDCSFFLALDLAGFAVESVDAERGAAALLRKGDRQWKLGFAQGQAGVLADGINVDGRWFAGRWDEGQLSKCLSGGVTSIWLGNALYFLADRPVDIALAYSAESIIAKVSAADRSWIRFKSFKPASISLNGCACEHHFDESTGVAWVQALAGKSNIVVNRGAVE